MSDWVRSVIIQKSSTADVVRFAWSGRAAGLPLFSGFGVRQSGRPSNGLLLASPGRNSPAVVAGQPPARLPARNRMSVTAAGGAARRRWKLFAGVTSARPERSVDLHHESLTPACTTWRLSEKTDVYHHIVVLHLFIVFVSNTNTRNEGSAPVLIRLVDLTKCTGTSTQVGGWLLTAGCRRF